VLIKSEELVRDWIDAWNAHDLERILSHYTDDVEFTTQTAVTRWNKSNGKLVGKVELRKHFQKGLELAPALRFELEEIFSAPGGYAVLYKRENGNRVLDAVELNEAGFATKVTAYYLHQQK